MSISKHMQVYHFLCDQISLGNYRPGQRMPTELELVDRFGVSRPTISRALGLLELEGKIVRRRGAGTFLSPEREGLFGLLIPRLHYDGIGGPIADGITRRAESAGHAVLLASSLAEADEESQEWGERVCERFIRHRVRGVFFVPLELREGQSEINQSIAERIVSAGIALVLIDRDVCDYPGRSGFDLVATDNRRAGIAVANHLFSCGHRRLAFVTDHPDSSSAQERFDGCAVACREAGVDLGSDRYLTWHPGMATEVLSGLVLQKSIDALVFVNDLLALDGLTSLRKLGIESPRDAGVVAFDDTIASRNSVVPLTTYGQPYDALGVNAFEAMRCRIDYPNQPARDIRLAGEMIVRESCGAAS